MKSREIEVGGYYVRQNGKGILHFYDINRSGYACYRCYNQDTGEYTHTCVCAVETLNNWLERRATPEEISRLHNRPEPEQREVPKRSYALGNALQQGKR